MKLQLPSNLLATAALAILTSGLQAHDPAQTSSTIHKAAASSKANGNGKHDAAHSASGAAPKKSGLSDFFHSAMDNAKSQMLSSLGLPDPSAVDGSSAADAPDLSDNPLVSALLNNLPADSPQRAALQKMVHAKTGGKTGLKSGHTSGGSFLSQLSHAAKGGVGVSALAKRH